MRDNRGFSLLELLIAVALATLLSLGFVSLAEGYQQVDRTLHQTLERDENLRLAPLLLSRFLWPAGNNRWLNDWAGVEPRDGSLVIRSDFDGPGGFPDRALDSPFEDILMRCRGLDLQLKSGSGSYQPLLRDIGSFEHFLLRSELLAVEVLGLADGAPSPLEERARMEFFLWNYRKNLFPEAVP